MKRKILLIAIGLTLFVIVLVGICNIVVNSNACGRTFDNADDIPPQNTALLLGTNPVSRYDHSPNFFYKARIEATASLYRKGKFKRLIISGDKHQGYDEPAAMTNDLVKLGIPKEVIATDGSGHRTLLSMKNIQQDFDIDSVIIISQKWHNERSIYLADKMGIHAIGYNAKDARNTRTLLTHIREKLARVKIFIDIYITNRKDFNL